jgi:hypothetical protein
MIPAWRSEPGMPRNPENGMARPRAPWTAGGDQGAPVGDTPASVRSDPWHGAANALPGKSPERSDNPEAAKKSP